MELTRHSFLPSSMKPSALCIALRRSAIELPVDFPSKWFNMGVKNMSPLNVVSSGCFVGFGESSIAMTSFCMPFDASQSGKTDQVEPSV